MNDNRKLALKVDGKDNVATVFSLGVSAGDEIEVRCRSGESRFLRARSAIPYGHKIALTEIPLAGHVIKYGEVIGAASETIQAGDYVHVHNMKALRGRGDL